MIRILSVVGTRPNIVKISSLYQEMQRRNNVQPLLVHTGQHHDRTMSESFFDDFALPEPDICLGVAGGTHAYQTGQIMIQLEPVLLEAKPDVVVVVGDVNSTLAAGLVAAKCGIPLAHVEAGLRSGDRTMPEEINRLLVDQLADYLFVTEQSGLDNLGREGIPKGKIFFVGNVMIDALMRHTDRAKESDVLQRLGLDEQRYALVTLHRPSNADKRAALEEILSALQQIGRDIPVVLPLHPRTRKRMAEFDLWPSLERDSRLLLIEPLGYIDFLCAMMHARVVLTDSGGIQEETTILGVPCLTLRNNTERPVTVECGTNQVVGTRGEDILRAYRALPKTAPEPPSPPPLWDGQAAGRVLDVLEEHCQSPERHGREG